MHDSRKFEGIEYNTSFAGAPFTFKLLPDGSGTMFDKENGSDHEISHLLASDVESLIVELPASHGDDDAVGDFRVIDDAPEAADLRDAIEDQFWDEWNDTLDDAKVMTDEMLTGEEAHVADPYTFEQLADTMKALILAWIAVHPKDERDWCIVTDPERAEDFDAKPQPTEMNDLVDAILDVFRPSGFEWVYNDGSHNRLDGYSEQTTVDCYDAYETYEESNARQRLNALQTLVDLLEPMKIDLIALCPELRPVRATAA